MGDLRVDTAVEGASADGAGRYVGTVSEDWRIWGPNGGYLAAIALRAVGRHTERARPASITCQFLRPGRFEEIELEVRTVRGTRRADAVHVTARQGGDDILTAQVWAVDETEGLVHHAAPMPSAGAPLDHPTRAERFAAAGVEEPQTFPFWDNFESRPIGWVVDWEHFRGGEPTAGGWYRFVGPPDPDPWVDGGRSVILIDTFTWPAAVQGHGPNPYIAPSLDVAVQLHHEVADEEWLFVEGRAPVAHRGTIGCTGQVWAPDGRLAALGTGTLLCLPAPG